MNHVRYRLLLRIAVAAFTVLAAEPAKAQLTGLNPGNFEFYGCVDETTTETVEGTGDFVASLYYPPGYTGSINVSFASYKAPTTFTVSHSNPMANGTPILYFSQNGVSLFGLVMIDDCCHYSMCDGGATVGDVTLTPPQLVFTPAAASSAVTVTNSRSVSVNITAEVTSGNSWLSVTAPNGLSVGPGGQIELLVSANPIGLQPGLNSGIVHFYLDPRNAVDMSVTMTIPPPPLPITWDAASLTFYAQPFGAPPAPQTLTVRAPTPTTFNASTTSSTGCVFGGWIGITPSGSLTTDQQIVVSPTQLGYSEGTCTGSVTLAVGGQTATIPVVMVLATSPTVYQLASAPSSLQFTYLEGRATPPAQSLQVSSAAPSTAVGFTASSSTAGAAQDWLHANIRSATSPFTISIAADPTGLPPGTYSGSLTILADTSSVTVPVTLAVVSPAVTAAPQSLSLTYQVGGSAPTGTIQVSAAEAGLNFTAVAMSAGWLSVSPGSGITPATGAASLTVSVNPASLSVGQTYTGSVTVAGTGGAAGTNTVTVTLQMLAEAPFISKIINAASGASGAVAPGEMISIFGAAIGPAIPVGLTLSGDGKVSTTAGGVQVIFLPGGVAAPITYAGASQVNAIVPYQVNAASNIQLQVNSSGQTSNAIPLTVTGAAPGIFSADGSGAGNAAALNFDATGKASYNSAANPAAPGSYVAFFVTGEGQTSPAGITGLVTAAQATAPITPQPVLPLSVFLDNQPVTAAFWGEEPAVVSGVMQVNIQIPLTARSGALPLSVSLGGAGSQGGVTLFVQ